MRAAFCWFSARIITRFYSHQPLLSSKGLISSSGLGKMLLKSPSWKQPSTPYWESCLPSISLLSKLKFTFATWLPRKGGCPLGSVIVKHKDILLLSNVGCQPDSRQARGSRRHNKGWRNCQCKLLPSQRVRLEISEGSEWSLLVVLLHQVLSRMEKF